MMHGTHVQKEPEGVMTIKFRDPLSAQACVIVSFPSLPHGPLPPLTLRPALLLQKMHGRFFAGRKIEASLWAGKTRFKRSSAVEDEEGGEGEEKKRLDDFANWLMTEGD